MKRNLHALLCFCSIVFIIPISGEAQMQIPNANFENWEDIENEDDSLVNWSSTSHLMFPPHVVLAKNDNAFQGDYAVNINTNPIGFTGASTVAILVNGEATFTFSNQLEYEQGGGTPISFQPTQLRGYYKFTTFDPNGDQAFARIILTKFNTMLNQRDTVSQATMNFTETDFYTEFTISLPDLLPGIEPDSITTIFYSSNPETVSMFGTQSTLTLDSLYLTADPVAIEEWMKEPIALYPNPTEGTITIPRMGEIGTIEFYSSDGKQLGLIESNILDGSYTVDLSHLSKGIYYLVPQNHNYKVTKLLVK